MTPMLKQFTMLTVTVEQRNAAHMLRCPVAQRNVQSKRAIELQVCMSSVLHMSFKRKPPDTEMMDMETDTGQGGTAV
jgi:hypothetical protein